MKTYEVTVYRDDKWWMVEIPELDGLTQARRVSEIKDMARDWIALTTNVAPAEVDVVVRSLKVGEHEVTHDQRELEHWREQEQAAMARYSEQLRGMAQALADKDVPVRDIGALAGVSYQRAQQLTSSKA